MQALGQAVLDRLHLTGDETVLDAGCGSGRITEALIERLPRGRVIAVDMSESMVAAARERLGPGADIRRSRPAGAGARRARRRDPLDRHASTGSPTTTPLFRRLHAALRTRRAAGRAVWGRGQHRPAARQGRRGAGARPVCRALPRLASRRGTTPAPPTPRRACARAGFATAECWLTPAPTAARAPARVSRHDRARPSRAAPARGSARAVHGRGARRAGRAGDRRLRAPEHRRDRLTPRRVIASARRGRARPGTGLTPAPPPGPRSGPRRPRPR